MLNIDELRYTYEKPFLELMDGMERRVDPEDSHKIVWYKNDGWYFEQDEKNGDLWCQYDRVWSFFKTNYTPKDAEIKVIIKYLMERHYKLRGLTPIRLFRTSRIRMERHYKLKGLTPNLDLLWSSKRW